MYKSKYKTKYDYEVKREHGIQKIISEHGYDRVRAVHQYDYNVEMRKQFYGSKYTIN